MSSYCDPDTPIVGDPAAVRSVAASYKKQAKGISRLHDYLDPSSVRAMSSVFLDYYEKRVKRMRKPLESISKKLSKMSEALDAYGQVLQVEREKSNQAYLDLQSARTRLDRAQHQHDRLPAKYPPVPLSEQDPYLASQLRLSQLDIDNARERQVLAKMRLQAAAGIAAKAFTPFKLDALEDPMGEPILEIGINWAIENGKNAADDEKGSWFSNTIEWVPYAGIVADFEEMDDMGQQIDSMNFRVAAGDITGEDDLMEKRIELGIALGTEALSLLPTGKLGKVGAKKGVKGVEKLIRKVDKLDSLLTKQRKWAFDQAYKQAEGKYSDVLTQHGMLDAMAKMDKWDAIADKVSTKVVTNTADTAQSKAAGAAANTIYSDVHTEVSTPRPPGSRPPATLTPINPIMPAPKPIR